MDMNKAELLNEDRIRRIEDMEDILNRLTRANKELERALDDIESLSDDFEKFKKYYFNGEWMDDYDALEEGLKLDIPHGVLSEDLPYDIFTSYFSTSIRMLELATEYIKK